MTTEELNQYDSLSESDKQQYKTLKSLHRSWNHEQLMCRITIDKKIAEHLMEQGDDNSEPEYMGIIEPRQSLIKSIIDFFK